MNDNPLGAVYAFVERAYIRLQANDVLTQCLDEGVIVPLQSLIESFVLAGPQGLVALREILEEVSVRKKQIDDDRYQILQKLETDLKPFGVRLEGKHTPLTLARLTPVGFLALIRQQGVSDEEQQLACLQLLEDAADMLKDLSRHQKLLDDGELILEDWIWGVIYQATHQEWPEGLKTEPPARWVH